jgi:hypothetical protein
VREQVTPDQQARQIVADLLRKGEDATIAKARLQEAKETPAIWVAETPRLYRTGGPYLGPHHGAGPGRPA